MHRLLPLILLAACGSGDLRGNWSGPCDLDADGRTVDLNLSVALGEGVEESEDGPLLYSGSMRVAEHDNPYTLTLRQDDSTVSFAATAEEETGDQILRFYINLLGTESDGTITGSGEYWTSIEENFEVQESLHLTGTCSLEQL